MINHLSSQKNQQISVKPVFCTDNLEWQAQIRDAITDLDELLSMLSLSHLRESLYVPEHFKLKVPRGFVAKMQVGDADDPLLKQILPDAKEQQPVTGFVADPLSEMTQNPNKGMLHKYKSRVLLTLTGACAVHCRYCFRQHFDYSANLPTSKDIQAVIDYITAHPDINEIILSGGDPLSLNNRKLGVWLNTLATLPQIRTLRLHTRLPIVIPERIDIELINTLSALIDTHCHVVMVVHVNHAQEIDDNTAKHLRLLQKNGITLLNQTVLLKEVNDTVKDLVDLSWRLFDAGVLPYYLHLLDKVTGSAHFMVSTQQAVELYWQLLETLPGYLMPKLVQELPHRPFKTPVDLYAHIADSA